MTELSAPRAGEMAMNAVRGFPTTPMLMAAAANPDLAAAMERNPVVVRGSDCRYDPFAREVQLA